MQLSKKQCQQVHFSHQEKHDKKCGGVNFCHGTYFLGLNAMILNVDFTGYHNIAFTFQAFHCVFVCIKTQPPTSKAFYEKSHRKKTLDSRPPIEIIQLSWPGRLFKQVTFWLWTARGQCSSGELCHTHTKSQYFPWLTGNNFPASCEEISQHLEGPGASRDREVCDLFGLLPMSQAWL